MGELLAGQAISLDMLDLAISAALVLLAGLVSVLMRLGVERRLGIAACRTVVQLLLIGYVLRVVFRLENAFLLALVVTVMIGAASRAAVQRSSWSFRGATWRAFLTLVLCSLLTTLVVTRAVIGVEPWYEPRYMIPLLGMVLGNSLTGISLCLDSTLGRLTEGRAQVEMELALGATRWEAARDPLRHGVARGMIPIINSMTVVGIVSLPGMMTGQILAGADPFEAVKYQVVVMFMIAAATALGCCMVAFLVYWRLFNSRHQLVAELIAGGRQTG